MKKIMLHGFCCGCFSKSGNQKLLLCLQNSSFRSSWAQRLTVSDTEGRHTSPPDSYRSPHTPYLALGDLLFCSFWTLAEVSLYTNVWDWLLFLTRLRGLHPGHETIMTSESWVCYLLWLYQNQPSTPLCRLDHSFSQGFRVKESRLILRVTGLSYNLFIYLLDLGGFWVMNAVFGLLGFIVWGGIFL